MQVSFGSGAASLATAGCFEADLAARACGTDIRSRSYEGILAMITRVGVSVAGRGNMLQGRLGYPIVRFDRADGRRIAALGVKL